MFLRGLVVLSFGVYISERPRSSHIIGTSVAIDFDFVFYSGLNKFRDFEAVYNAPPLQVGT